MNEYERYAYLYSAWTALVIPLLMTVYIVVTQMPSVLTILSAVLRVFGLFVSIAVLYAALGFYIRELFRATSKYIFQFPLFKEDETCMPTTEFLLFKNKLIAKELIVKVHELMSFQYGYTMLSEKEEKTDEQEARRNIVGAVSIMRKSTRGDRMLLQCNYRYGFQRNVLGGVVWSFLAISLFMIISIIIGLPFVLLCLVCLMLVLAQGVFAFVAMKYTARNYARVLINTFVSQNSK